MLSRAETHAYGHMVCICLHTVTFTCTHHSSLCLLVKVQAQAAEVAASKQLHMQDLEAHQWLWEDWDALRVKLATSAKVHTALQERADSVEADAAALTSQIAALQQQNTLLEAAVKAQAGQTAVLQQQNALLTQQNEQQLQQMLLLQQWLSAAPRLQMPVQSPSPNAGPDVLNPLQPPPVPSPSPQVHSEVALQLEPLAAPLLQADQQQLGLPIKVHSQVQPVAHPSRAAELEATLQPLQHSPGPQSDAVGAAPEARQPSAALALTPAAAPPALDQVSLHFHSVTLLPHELCTHADSPLCDPAGCTGWQRPPQHNVARAHSCRQPFHTRPGEHQGS